MEQEVKKIVDKYGKEILLNSKKFVSIFADMNPKMKSERKLLESAMSENIAELFANCAENERQTCIIKVRRKLKSVYIAEEGINDIIKCFTYALDWKSEYRAIKNQQAANSENIPRNNGTRDHNQDNVTNPKSTINQDRSEKETKVNQPNSQPVTGKVKDNSRVYSGWEILNLVITGLMAISLLFVIGSMLSSR